MAPRRRFDFHFKETVLGFAEETSGEEAARRFQVDPKRIRYWRRQKAELLRGERGRARLSGGGRRRASPELESTLADWIHSLRDRNLRVSTDMIQKKAREVYPSVSDGGKMFVASPGWVQRFLQRNRLSLRRTPGARAGPDPLTQELVSFVDFVGRTVRSKGVLERDIIAMDETAVCFDTVSPKAAGPGPSRLSAVLSARADGTKLPPYVVFRGAARGAKPRRRRSGGAVVAASVSGRMNDALAADWLRSVVGRGSGAPRLLVWDSYRCCVGAAAEAELRRGYDITTAEIPRGCAKFVQAPDVMWSRPFKQSLRDAYKDYTAGGHLKAPSRRLLVDWVVAAWDKLDPDLIRESFKVCGLSVRSDGSEDDLILCFREGQPCAAGREALSRARRQSQETWCEDEEDEEELFNNELLVVDEEEEEDSGEDDEDEDDHMSRHCFIHQALPSDDKKQIIIKEEQQDWSSSLDQEDPEPPHIKEEQEEVWTSQEGGQLQGLEEADITKFPFTPVPVKSEDDEEEPQSSQLHQRHTEQMETGADGEDCGGPEPDRNSDPDRHLQPDTEDQNEDSSEPETDDSEDWTETREPQSSGLKILKMSPCGRKDSAGGGGWYSSSKPFSCFKCGKEFGHKRSVQRHMTSHENEKSFSCSVCEKLFRCSSELLKHTRIHTGEKPFSCSVCGNRFARRESLSRHMRRHTGEKPFSCSLCLKRFRCSQYVVTHMRTHTGEKPFDCSLCGKAFCSKSKLTQHTRIHTEENRFSSP